MVDFSKMTNPYSISRPPRPMGSAEYQKDYKPENHSGCGCRYEPPVNNSKKVCRGCVVRYQIG